jgi:hypothetical protein
VAPAVGSWNPDGLTAYLNSSYGPFYLDNGVGGTNQFRGDTGPNHDVSQTIGPWGGYMPAVQFTAN